MNVKGVGVDITKRNRMTFEVANRFLSEKEIELMKTHENEESQLRFASGRWAAKESIIKATNKEYIFSDIEVLKAESGQPIVYHKGQIKENIKISISYEDEYAIAFCVIE